MRTPIHLILPLAFFIFTSSTSGTENAVLILLDANDVKSEVSGRILNSTGILQVSHEGKTFLTLSESEDPYHKNEWEITFSDHRYSGWKSLFLEITFFDEGVGVIQPQLLSNDNHQGKWIPPIRQVSFTRLNTKQVRNALFEFNLPDLDWKMTSHPHLKISGLQYVGSITAYPFVVDSRWNDLREAIPLNIEPLVKLDHPMEITCTVGIEDVGNPPSLERSLNNIKEYGPLAKLLGFTSIECFVRWDMIEPEPGHFDFGHYDKIVDMIHQYDLKWFPNLVITSAYSLPQWYYKSSENIGFICLEHHKQNDVPSIWNIANRKHVTRVLEAFANHYRNQGVLEAIRLGPSGNFGEAQFPAGAGKALGYQTRMMHAHIGWWAGDPFAQSDFLQFLLRKYETIMDLNRSWETQYENYSDIRPVLPEHYESLQARFDMTAWYTDSMTEWCRFWAHETQRLLPDNKVYQSSGGWGFVESGTDYTAQAESMIPPYGGIRLTNETDSFEQNVYATRLAATAARHYGINLGYEPAGYHSARGVVARYFNCLTTDADNLYTRHSVLFGDPLSISRWLRDYRLLDMRGEPLIDVAVYYPGTMNRLDDGAFRYLYGWGFNPRAAEIRRRIDIDFLDERLIRAKFLDRYKVLVMCWGNIFEKDVLESIDKWMREGGVIIAPSFPRGDYITLGGDSSIFQNWENGDTGKGAFFRFKGDMEPVSLYGDYVAKVLMSLRQLHPWTQYVLNLDHPPQVFYSILKNGHLAVLNYSDDSVQLSLAPLNPVTLQPYTITIHDLATN